jgi:Domain of unknown function (DUF6894)
MPHYWFALTGVRAIGHAGRELANDGAAKREAVAVARDFARNNLSPGNDSITVKNGRGEIVHEEPFVWN